MSKFFLTFSLLFSLTSSIVAQDSTIVVIADIPQINYPGKPLVMSLVIPGAGQFYNKSPLWKSATFLGLEIGSIVIYYQYKNRADQYRSDYQTYADIYWNLTDWVNNRFDVGMADEWSNFPALLKLSGTHELTLVLSGLLKEEFGEFVSSDSLDYHQDWIESGEISIVKDRHFYENIGKYDQFVGGWLDANSDWYWEEKDVGDSIEIIIKTHYKEEYLGKREDSNQMLTLAKYSITTLLFNHVISGLEAVLTSQRMAREKQTSESIETDISLMYNPNNPAGIGGLSLTINF